MGIFDRMSRVFKSNVNAALDKATDPAKEVELLVAEMEGQIKKARLETAQTMGAERLAARRIGELTVESARFAERAELAVKSGDDELARQALARQQEVERALGDARAEQREAAALAERQKTAIKSFEAKLRTVKANKGTVKAKVALGKTQGAATSAFDEFERMAGRVDEEEGALDAAGEVDAALHGERQETERKLAALDKGGDLDDRLAALKKKLDDPR